VDVVPGNDAPIIGCMTGIREVPSTILITGRPGCGKTTLVKSLLPDLLPFHPAGFYTEEIRENTTRVGFSAVSLDGRRIILAHAGLSSRFRVGKYGVDTVAFDAFLGELEVREAGLVVIDEIGKMECLSGLFCRMVEEIISSGNCLLATIAIRGTPFSESLKKRDDVSLYLLGRENQRTVAGEVLRHIRALKNPA